MRIAWLLNLDAEAELAAHRAGRATNSTGGSARRRQAAARATLARAVGEGGLLGPRDLTLDPETFGPGTGGALAGLDPSEVAAAAWMPTPLARSILGSVGLELDGPPAGVLIEANARETFAALDPLPDATVARSPGELRAAVERAPVPRSGIGASDRAAWVLRRSLCCAGGGRLIAERWGPEVAAWGEAALADGPVEVQPLVDIVDEYSIHGWVGREGELRLGLPLCWRPARGTKAPAEGAALSDVEAAKVTAAGREVGIALGGLGYFGPFGVDAFRWQSADGALRLQVGTDVNARMTLHFSRGAPELLPAASAHQEHLAEG